MPIWNPELETASRERIREIQTEKLIKIVSYVYERVPFYKNKLDEAGVKPEDIKTLKDIQKLPVTTKDDLRNHYPYGMFAVPMDEIVRIHASSGTTGKPTVVGYTANDLETWSELVARLVSASGVTSKDIAQVSFGYGLFTGAFGLHYGLEKVGAAVIPASSGNTKKQIQLMKDFESTTLISTPSYALHIIDYLHEMNIDPKKDLKLKYGLFGAEPWTDSMRQEIEKEMSIIATDNYGMSELIGPGVCGECLERNGMHIHEDHFIVEVIDPDTGEWLDEGETGEIIITPLSKEALPLLRYQTRDISRMTSEPCACGRTTARLFKMTGRTDDMLIIRGVNIFPSQIEEVLLDIEGVAPHYLIVADRVHNMDILEVQVEAVPEIFFDQMKQIVELEKKIIDRLYSVLGIKVELKLVEPKSIERSMGKAKRVIDKRK